MAAYVTDEQTLSIVAEFTDGDDRTLTMPNPVSGLSWADIDALTSDASIVLLGDRNAANFYRFKEAYVTNKHTIIYDFTG